MMMSKGPDAIIQLTEDFKFFSWGLNEKEPKMEEKNVNERLDRLEKELKELNRRRILDRFWLEGVIRHNTRRSGARLQYVVDCNKFYFNLFNEEQHPEIRGKIEEEIAAKYSDYRARVKAFEKEFESSAISDSAKRCKEEAEGNYFMDDIFPLDMTHEAPELRAKVRQEREERLPFLDRKFTDMDTPIEEAEIGEVKVPARLNAAIDSFLSKLNETN